MSHRIGCEYVRTIDDLDIEEHRTRTLVCTITGEPYPVNIHTIVEDPFDIDDALAEEDLVEDPYDASALPPDLFDPDNPLFSFRIIA